MIENEDKQWRIDNARHLEGLRSQRRLYAVWSDGWDHDHCAACWGKLCEREGDPVEQQAYATGDDYPKGACYEWVCQACFNDLKVDMQWSTTGK